MSRIGRVVARKHGDVKDRTRGGEDARVCEGKEGRCPVTTGMRRIARAVARTDTYTHLRPHATLLIHVCCLPLATTNSIPP